MGVGVTLLSYLAIYALKRLLTIRVSRFFARASKWDDIIVHTVEQTTQLWMLGTSFYLAFQVLRHPRAWDAGAHRAYFILSMVQVAIWANYLLDRWIIMTVNRKVRRNPAAATSIGIIQLLTKIFVLSAVLLFTLNNLGIRITTILTGLGVGGIAVALALQRILGDLFSSLSIVMDKPFVVGDFIVLDQFMGEVEKVGLKTTRIRSLGGEQIIISNSDLLASRIRNFKRMHERRAIFTIGLPLTSTTEELKKAISLIKAIISSQDRIRFERCHFSSINKVSMDIETVYWVLSDDMTVHMDLQQEILFSIQHSFHQEGLKFARPVQSVTMDPAEFVLRNAPAGMSTAETSQTVS